MDLAPLGSARQEARAAALAEFVRGLFFPPRGRSDRSLVGERAPRESHSSSKASSLEAFSCTPTHGSFSALACRPTEGTGHVNQRFLSYLAGLLSEWRNQ